MRNAEKLRTSQQSKLIWYTSLLPFCESSELRQKRRLPTLHEPLQTPRTPRGASTLHKRRWRNGAPGLQGAHSPLPTEAEDQRDQSGDQWGLQLNLKHPYSGSLWLMHPQAPGHPTTMTQYGAECMHRMSIIKRASCSCMGLGATLGWSGHLLNFRSSATVISGSPQIFSSCCQVSRSSTGCGTTWSSPARMAAIWGGDTRGPTSLRWV